MSSIIAQNSLYKSTNKMNTALQRLSTGLRINSAKDDAAGSAISTKLEYKVSSYDIAKDNAQMGQSMLDTANSTLSKVNSMLQRMRDLSEQAANGTYGKEEREAMQAEVDALSAEIKRIKNTTEFNGKKLFETESETETATQINTNTNKPVMLSAISNNGIATYAGEISMADIINGTVAWADTDGKTISISSGAELQKLAELTNAGNDTTGRTFTLTADIDMAEEGITNFTPIGNSTSNTFKGVFDGQGYTISNLTINSSDEYVGLFGHIYNSTISNVNLDNISIEHNYKNGYTGSLVGRANRVTISSCSVSGKITGNSPYVGGLGGIVANNSIVTKCSADIELNNTNPYNGVTVGGLIATSKSTISECTASGSITVNNSRMENVGGFIGHNYGSIEECSSSVDIKNNVQAGSFFVIGGFIGANGGNVTDCIYTGEIDDSCIGGNIGAFIGKSSSSSATLSGNKYKNNTTTGGTDLSAVGGGKTVSDDEVKHDDSPAPTPTPSSKKTTDYCRFNLQVGIDSTENSVIEIDTGFKLGDFTISLLDSEDGTIKGDENARKALDTIDALMARVTNKMTDIASTQNRIESVIEFQEIQRNALTSANSLIKDADIALESANYLKNQILQSVTSSILATANQNPQIALQLI